MLNILLNDERISFSAMTILLLVFGFVLLVVGGILIGWQMSWFGGTHQISWLKDQGWFALGGKVLTFEGVVFLNIIEAIGVFLCIVGGVIIFEIISGITIISPFRQMISNWLRKR